MSELVCSPEAGIFAPLADPELFALVSVQLVAPTWPGELDTAPDAIHDAILDSENRSCRLGAANAA